MEKKNCLHEDDVGKKMFAETYMFKKNVCGDVYVKKKNVCGDVYV